MILFFQIIEFYQLKMDLLVVLSIQIITVDKAIKQNLIKYYLTLVTDKLNF